MADIRTIEILENMGTLATDLLANRRCFWEAEKRRKTVGTGIEENRK